MSSVLRRMMPLGVALALGASCARHDLPPPSAREGSTRAEGEPPAADPPSTTSEDPVDDNRQPERDAMVEEQLAGRDVHDPRVLAVMRRVPRHRFVRDSDGGRAYGDHPLPIVGGQTISQPYIVGFMTQAAGISAGERCLEIGTGSGYQAAVLAELCRETYSIEYLPEVAEFGRRNLEATGYLERDVHLRTGDGYLGWPEAAPFDAILVTAAPEHVPQPLLDQLAIGGRLVIPVGPQHGVQQLEIWTRVEPGSEPAAFRKEELFSVRFVPFLGR